MEKDLYIKEIKLVLEMMGIKTKEITTFFDNDLRILFFSIRVPSYEERIFFENNNEVLRDFSHFFKLLFEKKYHFYQDSIFDINKKNIHFVAEAKQKALIAAERVLFFDKPYEFKYSNAFERMIIHSMIKKNPLLYSYSEGEGKERYLIIKKKTPK
ncbi:MAG: hypothetical protein PHC89_01425 [Candidatus Pacebacteria bacterium]|nr:hypothetical protein [Candidatus Paceibacterota bacterium]